MIDGQWDECGKREKDSDLQNTRSLTERIFLTMNDPQRKAHLYPVNAKVNARGERSPHEENGKKGPKRPCIVHLTKLPIIKKTANEPGDPRIEEDGTWNSNRDAHSGGRPVSSMSLIISVRRIALRMRVGICRTDRLYRWWFGFLLVVCWLNWADDEHMAMKSIRGVLTGSRCFLDHLCYWLLRRGGPRGLSNAFRSRISVFRGLICVW